MISAIIVDDKKHNRFSLKRLLDENCPAVELLEEAGSVEEALLLFKKHDLQLVFLDIEMGDANGFDLLRRLDKINFKVIFVTAHSHYAIKAIKYSAVDYLLKPVDATDLIAAVKKAVNEINFDHNNHYRGLLENLKQNHKKLAVPVRNGITFLDPAEIIRLEANINYTYIFTKEQKFTTAKNIKEYENLLVERCFFRSHKSHLINLSHVKSIKNEDGYFAEMSDGSIVEISRRKKEEFILMMSLH